MPRNDRYRRYLEAAAVLGEITRARAEELVKELKGGGDVQRAQAQQWVDELVERGRDAAGDLVDIVRSEVSKQLQALGLDPEDLAHQAAEVMRRTAEAGRRVVYDVAPGAGTRTARPHGGSGATATAKKAAGAKKAATTTAQAPGAPAKKAPATKAAAKKAAATKTAAAKKTAATKSAAAKSGAAKKSVTKAPSAKAPSARKSVAKTAPASTTKSARPRTATTDAR
ncbi:MAG: hypothetical protein ACYCSX_11620 [Acidimicrobiales bacterium]